MKHTYYDCQCISNTTDSDLNPKPTVQGSWSGNDSSPSPADTGIAFSGQCPEECMGFKPYVVILTLIMFLQSCTQNPGMYIGVRCVAEEDRSMAIGLRSVIGKVLGLFPAPIYFGAIVNSMCVHWQYTDGERGACWFYDRAGLRKAYIGFGTALYGSTLILLFLMYRSIKEDLCTSKKSNHASKGEGSLGDPESSNKSMREKDAIPMSLCESGASA